MALTAEEQSQFLKDFTGIDPEAMESLEKAKEQFNTTYLPRKEAAKDPDIVAMAVGKLAGSLKTTLKSLAPDVDFLSPELKDAKVEDLVKASFGFNSEKIKTLELSLKTAGSGDVTKVKDEYEGKIKGWEKKYSELNDLHIGYKTEMDTRVQTIAEQTKREKIAKAHDDAYRAIPFKAELKEDKIFQAGFAASVAQVYGQEIGDDEKVYALKEGKRISSKKSAQNFMEWGEALEIFATENGKIAGNPVGGRPLPFVPPPAPGQPTVPNSPDAIHAARLANRSTM